MVLTLSEKKGVNRFHGIALSHDNILTLKIAFKVQSFLNSLRLVHTKKNSWMHKYINFNL